MPIKPKHEHSDRDRIFTPEKLAIELIKKIPAEPHDRWCDPCYGTGVFFNNFPTQNKDYYEIDMGRDFLKPKVYKTFDWCVTNIPFSQPKEFIGRMAQASNKGFGILCLANSMTATRLKQLEDAGFNLYSMTVCYVREWGFGYRTDFYVFTNDPVENLKVIIV